ncbi:MAG: response regulator [Salinivirgaceae bacterium]|nr:response regulator [Salinivirgaceae bacterium]
MKFVIFNIILFSCFLLSIDSKAQLEHITVQNIANKNGLSNNYINCLAQDQSGYIWIGTKNGLNRYDGYNMKTYFNNPSDSTSLSDNNITALCIDVDGNLWIGTQNNGLCRYNSVDNNFIRYESQILSNKKLSYHFITDIKIDSYGHLWVATQEGLNIYKKELDEFEQINFELNYKLDIESIRGLKEQNLPDYMIKVAESLQFKTFNSKKEFIKAMQEVARKMLTVSEIESVLVFSKKWIPEELKKFNHFKIMAPDSKGNLWLGYQDAGFAYYNVKTNEINRFTIFPNISSAEWANSICSIIIEEDILWLGTFNDGVYKYSINNKTFNKVFDKNKQGALAMAKYKSNIMFFSEKVLYLYPNSIKANDPHSVIEIPLPEITFNVTAILKDNSNNFWLASEGDGVFMIYENKKFNQWDNTKESDTRLSKKAVSSIHADKQGNLYIGYYRNNIDKINTKNNTILTYRNDLNYAKGSAPGSVLALNTDSRNNLWIGSYYAGLQKMNLANGKELFFNYNGIIDFRGIAFDENDNIWAVAHGNGLMKINPNGNLIKQWRADYINWETNLTDDWINDICIDKFGQIWIATTQGITTTDTAAVFFKSYKNILGDSTSLSHNSVIAIYCDHKNNIWIGTENGLNLFDRYTEKFERFTNANGLSNSSISSIIEDHKGNIWLGTTSGISKLNISYSNKLIVKNIENYDIHDGVAGEYHPHAVARTTDGNIYFGGKNGITWFHSDSIMSNNFLSNVVISDIEIFNESIFNKNSKLSKYRKSYVKHNIITLDYNQKVIGIIFTALNFVQNSQNQYSCKLEGFDNKWQIIGNSHRVTYTNLEPGKYIFKVKAFNNNGTNSKQATNLEIIVLPPFWRSTIGYILSFIIVLICLVLIYWGLSTRIQLKNRVKLRKLEAENLLELDKSKSTFFTNITHEFRTPITLILGPIKKVINTDDDKLDGKEVKKLLKIVYRNAELLERLVNQILDFKKADAGKLSFKPVYGNVIRFVINIAETFSNLAMDKNIVFNIYKDRDELFMMFSPDKMEKIVYNLLSNAFKYTLEMGRVDINIGMITVNGNDMLRIKVIDTGIGISDENLKNIFSLYYQADDPRTKGITGTGVGLYMVKTYAELHSGSVSILSALNKGSEFIVQIPVQTQGIEAASTTFPDMELSAGFNELQTSEQTNKLKILIVEDNIDILYFLKNELSDYFRVVSAKNGEEALKLLKNSSPDLIISDVMMPIMDGYELCQKVKKSIATCHIPFILLTAKISHDSKVKGYSVGADDYITKPFDVEILIIKIQRILELRKNVQEQINNNPNTIPAEIKNKNNAESAFLEKLLKIMETNLDNPDLDVDFLAKKLYLGRTLMYEKVNILTGQPVADFIRTYRLNRAAQMIETGECIISEIVWKVGFKSHAHFSRAFKQKFACTPSNYLKKLRG